MWRDPDARMVPPCCEPQGCKIEDLATDQSLLDDCLKFMTAKRLFMATEDPKVQEKVFQDLGLYDEPRAHLEMESLWMTWVEQHRPKSPG